MQDVAPAFSDLLVVKIIERLRRWHSSAEEFLDTRTIAAEGVDVAAQDFLAGMTDRYAVRLYEELFIPKPWVQMSRVRDLA